MARLTIQNPETAHGELRGLFDAVKAKLGKVPNMMRVLGNSPAALKSYLELSSTLAHGVLSHRVREQIALLSAERNACHYCVAAHTVLGKMAGLSAEETVAAREGKATDARELAALRLAGALLEKRGAVSAAEMQAARAALSEAEIVEIICGTALNILTNYVNVAADVDVDFPRVN